MHFMVGLAIFVGLMAVPETRAIMVLLFVLAALFMLFVAGMNLTGTKLF